MIGLVKKCIQIYRFLYNVQYDRYKVIFLPPFRTQYIGIILYIGINMFCRWNECFMWLISFFSENQRKKNLNGHRIRETNQNTSSSMRRRLVLVKGHVPRIVLSGTNFCQSWKEYQVRIKFSNSLKYFFNNISSK